MLIHTQGGAALALGYRWVAPSVLHANPSRLDWLPFASLTRAEARA